MGSRDSLFIFLNPLSPPTHNMESTSSIVTLVYGVYLPVEYLVPSGTILHVEDLRDYFFDRVDVYTGTGGYSSADLENMWNSALTSAQETVNDIIRGVIPSTEILDEEDIILPEQGLIHPTPMKRARVEILIDDDDDECFPPTPKKSRVEPAIIEVAMEEIGTRQMELPSQFYL